MSEDEKTEIEPIEAVRCYVPLDTHSEVCVIAFTRIEQPWGLVENREPTVSEMALAMEAMCERGFNFTANLPG